MDQVRMFIQHLYLDAGRFHFSAVRYRSFVRSILEKLSGSAFRQQSITRPQP
jgi:hypothetical protein